MANRATPIDHDFDSSMATGVGEAAKWGLGGAIAAFVVGAAVATGGVALVGGLVGGFTSVGFGGGAAYMITGAGSAFTAVAATLTALWSGVTYGTTAALAGGALGLLKGSSRASAESAAYHSQSQSRQNKLAKAYNEGEIKGVQEGYEIARKDMEPQVQAAFQKGQEFVVGQIQQHMMEQQQQAMTASAPVAATMAAKPIALGDKTAQLSTTAICGCESHVDLVNKQREAAAAAPKTLGA